MYACVRAAPDDGVGEFKFRVCNIPSRAAYPNAGKTGNFGSNLFKYTVECSPLRFSDGCRSRTSHLQVVISSETELDFCGETQRWGEMKQGTNLLRHSC